MKPKVIEKLTKAQEAKIPEYVETYRQIGLSTTPGDRKKAEAAIRNSAPYKDNATPPEFIWKDSPEQGALLAAQLAKGSEDVTAEEVRAQADMASFGSFEAYWVSFYAYIVEQLPVDVGDKRPVLEAAKDIIENCGLYWTFEDVVICTEKPVAIHMKDKKLHNPNGLALEYKDGTGVFAIDGVRYDSLLAMTIEKNAK